MAKNTQTPQAEVPEQNPEPSPPINIQEPETFGLAHQVVATDEKPADWVDPAPAVEELSAAEREQVERDRKKREFHEKVMAARHPPQAAPYMPPPPPPRLRAQIDAELEAGRQAVAHHEKLKVQRQPPAAEKPQETVFRPADYVPDQRKGQGNLRSRTLPG
ncbi:MAG: hypothetical protein KGL39_51775 [Patescibacteria group bacterium]|nr:hypothetical protein [Patescibacteria group bacterium]